MQALIPLSHSKSTVSTDSTRTSRCFSQRDEVTEAGSSALENRTSNCQVVDVGNELQPDEWADDVDERIYPRQGGAAMAMEVYTIRSSGCYTKVKMESSQSRRYR